MREPVGARVSRQALSKANEQRHDAAAQRARADRDERFLRAGRSDIDIKPGP